MAVMRAIRILFGASDAVDWATETTLAFGNICQEIRERGYFYDGSCVYVPYHSIRMILEMGGEHAPMQVEGMTRQ